MPRGCLLAQPSRPSPSSTNTHAEVSLSFVSSPEGETAAAWERRQACLAILHDLSEDYWQSRTWQTTGVRKERPRYTNPTHDRKGWNDG